MATVSLSPSPISVSAVMSSRRGPLASNPNVANSPLRGASTLSGYPKQKRSYATVQREEAYGQPPPVKKQALENGAQRPVRSPSKLARPATTVQRAASRLPTRGPASKTQSITRSQEADNIEAWKKHHRLKFPQMIFYFESIPDDLRAKLTKKIAYLGARQEPFFSIEVTHVVTTRTIPSASTEHTQVQETVQEEPEEQPKTINPSLLDRSSTAARRKLLFDFKNVSSRSQQLDGSAKLGKGARNNDVLVKAKEMGKKIWPLDKFQMILNVLLESEAADNALTSKTTAARSQIGSKSAHEPNLFKLLHAERVNGPSDRDPSAANRELVYFKGPHIYVWDMDEKQKPMMARDYPKVANKADGEWPQFRSVGNGRCPFVEEVEVHEKDRRREREAEKARAARRQQAVPALNPPEAVAPKPLTGKRSLSQMEDGHNKLRGVTPTDVFNPAKAALSKQLSKQQELSQNAFTSRAKGARLFAGEPVASGMQPSNITSAIRSQMISSTSGIGGAKAGTSKEIHGLQRKVLQKNPLGSRDLSSRPFNEVSMDVASSRSTTAPPLSRQTSKAAMTQDEDSQQPAANKERRTQTQALKSKKDLKPGYCENCQDKFRDFDEHILSRKHRKFAENADNWVELDDLLGQLKRAPKYACDSEDEEFWH